MTQHHAVLIDHQVSDYEAWKSHFDDHRSAREKASITAEHVNRAVDDPTRVIIFLSYEDPDAARAFFDSEDLRATMQKAGVTGPPTITFMSPQSQDVVWDRALPAMIVKHDVANYDAWRKVYDNADTLRRENGIIGHAVNRAGDDGNTVFVYHQAETREALEKFMALPELRDAMAKGGVVEAPLVTFVNGGL